MAADDDDDDDSFSRTAGRPPARRHTKDPLSMSSSTSSSTTSPPISSPPLIVGGPPTGAAGRWHSNHQRQSLIVAAANCDSNRMMSSLSLSASSSSSSSSSSSTSSLSPQLSAAMRVTSVVQQRSTVATNRNKRKNFNPRSSSLGIEAQETGAPDQGEQQQQQMSPLLPPPPPPPPAPLPSLTTPSSDIRPIFKNIDSSPWLNWYETLALKVGGTGSAMGLGAAGADVQMSPLGEGSINGYSPANCAPPSPSHRRAQHFNYPNGSSSPSSAVTMRTAAAAAAADGIDPNAIAAVTTFQNPPRFNSIAKIDNLILCESDDRSCQLQQRLQHEDHRQRDQRLDQSDQRSFSEYDDDDDDDDDDDAGDDPVFGGGDRDRADHGDPHHECSRGGIKRRKLTLKRRRAGSVGSPGRIEEEGGQRKRRQRRRRGRRVEQVRLEVVTNYAVSQRLHDEYENSDAAAAEDDEEEDEEEEDDEDEDMFSGSGSTSACSTARRSTATDERFECSGGDPAMAQMILQQSIPHHHHHHHHHQNQYQQNLQLLKNPSSSDLAAATTAAAATNSDPTAPPSSNPIVEQQHQEDKQLILHTNSLKNLIHYSSHAECKLDICQLENVRDHYHCYDPPCCGKTLHKKEETIRHVKWHKKRTESLSYGFLRFSSSDDCSQTFGEPCQHNRKQTHYHCFQPNCDRVYISTSDVQMHSNFHRKDSAIHKEGFQRYRASEECNVDYCTFAGLKMTHFHCRRDNCRYTFKNKAEMEKHKAYHVKDMQLARDGFKKFLKTESCPFEQCRFSRVCNHIHCVRENCFYVLHSSGQQLSHKRKHERLDNEQAYCRYKMMTAVAQTQAMLCGGGGGGGDNSNNTPSPSPPPPPLDHKPFMNLKEFEMSAFAAAVAAVAQAAAVAAAAAQAAAAAAAASASATAAAAGDSDNCDGGASPKSALPATEPPQPPQSASSSLSSGELQQSGGQSTATTTAATAATTTSFQMHPFGGSPSICDEMPSTAAAAGAASTSFVYLPYYFTDKCPPLPSPSLTKTNPLDNETNSDNWSLSSSSSWRCCQPKQPPQQQPPQPQSHCKANDFETVLPSSSLAEIQEHIRTHDLMALRKATATATTTTEAMAATVSGGTTTAVDSMSSSSSSTPMQITTIDGFFNRKRGRPPKNRFVEVYKNAQQSPQAIFTSFKLEKQQTNVPQVPPPPPPPVSSPAPGTFPAQTQSLPPAAAQQRNYNFDEINLLGSQPGGGGGGGRPGDGAVSPHHARDSPFGSHPNTETFAESFNRRFCRFDKAIGLDCGIADCRLRKVRPHLHCRHCHCQISPFDLETHNCSSASPPAPSPSPCAKGQPITDPASSNLSSNLRQCRTAPSNTTIIDCDQEEEEVEEQEKVSVVRAAGTFFPAENHKEFPPTASATASGGNKEMLTWAATAASIACVVPFCKLKRKLHDHCPICNQAFCDPVKSRLHRSKHSEATTVTTSAASGGDGGVVAADQPQDLSVVGPMQMPKSPIVSATDLSKTCKAATSPTPTPPPPPSSDWTRSAYSGLRRLQSPVPVSSLQLAQFANQFYKGQTPTPTPFGYYQSLYPPFVSAAAAAAAAVAAANQSQTDETEMRAAMPYPFAGVQDLQINPNLYDQRLSLALQDAIRKRKSTAAAATATVDDFSSLIESLQQSPPAAAAAVAAAPAFGNCFLGQTTTPPNTTAPGPPLPPPPPIVHGNFRLKDEQIPIGYLRFRFNEDCFFPKCGYRNHQSHFHCDRADCHYSFCDKTRFVQHTARHERLDKLMGDDFRQFRANMSCGYESCAYFKNLGSTNKSSHFHCLKCNFICSDTNKVVAHRRQHSKMEYIRLVGFRKVANNEKCNLGGGGGSGGGGDAFNSNLDASTFCPYSLKLTHYHCLVCECSVLSRAQLASHKHKTVATAATTTATATTATTILTATIPIASPAPSPAPPSTKTAATTTTTTIVNFQ